ncbi:DUF7948 domain-containing protein [[Eubacterium] cellulosolvens]
MKKVFVFLIVFILFFSTWVVNSEKTEDEEKELHSAPTPQTDLNGLGGNCFTLNKGQVSEPEVIFHSKNAYFTPTGVIFRVFGEVEPTEIAEYLLNPVYERSIPQKMHVYKMKFLGANPTIPTGLTRINHNTNFFLGNDSTKWCTDVPNFHEIIYENLYDNIDLLYKVVSEGIKYEFVVHPGGDVDDIHLEYEGADIRTDETNLYIHTSVSTIVDGGLYVYQIKNQKIIPVEAKVVVKNNKVNFEVSYDEAFDLIIDPLIYSTFIGGSSVDGGNIELDKFENVYMAGNTESINFPTTPGAFDRTYNNNSILPPPFSRDVFVTKFNPNCSKLIYSTYIGGNKSENIVGGIIIDKNFNAYVAGSTLSEDFPVTDGAYDTVFNGQQWNAFILKLNYNGSKLIQSTYIGGAREDYASDFTVDSKGYAYVTGFTKLSDFPIPPGCHNTTFGGRDYAIFVVKLNLNFSSLLYCTYMGGENETAVGQSHNIEVDTQDNVYLTGIAYKKYFLDFPTTPGAYDTKFNGGNQDAFVLKLNQTGSKIIFSTFIGGNSVEYGSKLFIDSNNNVFLVGLTNSSNFPITPGSFDTIINGENDTFFLKLNPNGSSLLYSTFIGGSDFDHPSDLYINKNNCICIAGFTNSSDFPLTLDAINNTLNNGNGSKNYDGFILKLDITNSKLLYSTFFGGASYDWIGYMKINDNGDIYIGGSTLSPDFPTTPGAYSRIFNGAYDGFVSKISLTPTFSISSVSLLLGPEPTDIIYSRYCSYTYRIKILETRSLTDIKRVTLFLDPAGINIQMKWERDSSNFVTLNDPNHYINLGETCRAYNDSLNVWTIDFDVIFNWNYPDEDLNDVQVKAMHAELPDAWLNKSNFYQVENDLVFDGELLVKRTNNNQTIEEGGQVRCGEELNWSGLIPVYENTTDVFPPEYEFDISVWDETGNKWFDSPAAGEPFEIHNQAPVKPFPNGLKYIINISGIPSECDHTNESFTITIDWRNLTFTNATPDDKTWQTTSNVLVGVTITNIGLGLVNGSTVMNCISTDNGTTWRSWEAVSGLKSAVSVDARDSVLFKEGRNNLIKWRAKDSFNNEPIQSENYRILVDTKDVVFSDAFPSETTVSESENVSVGITISDITSGVRASTIEYAVSKDAGITWSTWTKPPDLEDSTEVKVRLNLTFQDGDANRIKWRASDIAGNGPAQSQAYKIKVKVTPSKLKVQLLSPKNGSIITGTSINLSWALVNSNLSNIIYDIILDTIGIPTKIIAANYTKTYLTVTNLTNSTTYYWQVIPKLGTQYGLCISGIWSFTVNISYRVPAVFQIYPRDKEILRSKKPTLSWSLNYSGIENVEYDIYLDTNYPPKMIIEKHPYTNCTLYEELEDGKTYYWKVVPRVGDLKGPASEIWSFTINSKYRPSLDFDLKVEPAIIELKPGELTKVKIIIINLGELRNNILLSIKDPANDTTVTLILPEFNEIVIEPKQVIEFYMTVSVNKSAAAGEVIFIVEGVSTRAEDFGIDLKKNAQLTVRIISEDTEPRDSQKAYYLWAIYLIVIVIVILLVLIFLKLEKDKLLLNFQRKAIFDAIKSNPGIHFRELMRDLSVKSGTLSYHINLLEKKGHIKSIQKGVYRCFYPTGATTDFKIVLSSIQQRMLVDIKDKPGITLSELSHSLGKNKMLLYYHANILEDAGVITKEKRGRISIFYITPKAALYLE